MALVPCQTNANPSLSLLGGGGGGSPGSNITVSTVTTQVMNVSSIVGNDGGELTIKGANGIFIDTNPGLGILFPVAGAIDFQDNKGVMTGVSSINNAPYPPAGASLGTVSTITATVHVGNAPQTFTPLPMTVQQNKYYMCSANILDFAITSGTLQNGDSLTVYAGSPAGQDAIGVYDLVQLSTMRGRGLGGGLGSVPLTPCGQVESLSTTMEFSLVPNSNINVSTFVSMAGWANAFPL